MSLTVYQYPACSTCKRALKWLAAQGIAYEAVHIVEHPPSVAVLRSAMQRGKLPLRSLFNTSGESYRNGGFKDTLPTMSEEQALHALSSDGKLIKRPLVVGDQIAFAGFDESKYASAFGG